MSTMAFMVRGLGKKLGKRVTYTETRQGEFTLFIDGEPRAEAVGYMDAVAMIDWLSIGYELGQGGVA